MKFKLLTITAGIALLASSITAKAQKAYKEGLATYTISSPKGDAEAKSYFKADSNLTTMQMGPATINILSIGEGDYLAILVNVPVANMKKAAVATPAEIEDFRSKLPTLTFTPGTETKQIAGFNCKKVVAKDDKGNSYDIWITNDISVPNTGLSQLYEKVGGFPVQFVTLNMGKMVNVVLKSISEEKVPAGIFTIPTDYERISMSDLQAMGGKRN